MTELNTHPAESIELTASSRRTDRFRAWPLWATAAGAVGLFSTVGADKRAGDTSDLGYTVTVADMASLDHVLHRIGGTTGYAAVALLLVFAAVWHRRVAQRFSWSLGAPVVTFGLIASAAALTLAYGWKGALGNYSHGAMEEGTYDEPGLYVYYVMNDFSPYIGWFPVTVAAAGLAWMAFRERLVSRVLGASRRVRGAAALRRCRRHRRPGPAVRRAVGLVVVGIWLAVGRSPIVLEDAA